MVKEGGEQHLDQSDMAGLACTSGAEVLRRLLRTVPVFSVEAAGEDFVGNVLPLKAQEAPGPVASSAAGGYELMNSASSLSGDEQDGPVSDGCVAQDAVAERSTAPTP